MAAKTSKTTPKPAPDTSAPPGGGFIEGSTHQETIMAAKTSKTTPKPAPDTSAPPGGGFIEGSTHQETIMAAKTSKTTPKPAPDTSAPAPAAVNADVSTTAAAPAAAEVAPPAATEAPPIVAAVEEAPLAGAVEGEAFGDFLPRTGNDNALLDQAIAENVVTHTIRAFSEKGFCRAGMRWHREPTFVNRADWTDEQWDSLTSEKSLEVKEIDL